MIKKYCVCLWVGGLVHSFPWNHAGSVLTTSIKTGSEGSQIRAVSVRDNESKEKAGGILVMYFNTMVREAPNDECLLFSTHLLWARRESSKRNGSRNERAWGSGPTVEAAMTPGRPRKRELLELDFINGLQRTVCEPLKFHARYYVYKRVLYFFFLLWGKSVQLSIAFQRLYDLGKASLGS